MTRLVGLPTATYEQQDQSAGYVELMMNASERLLKEFIM
jgi:hypothetical protein